MHTKPISLTFASLLLITALGACSAKIEGGGDPGKAGDNPFGVKDNAPAHSEVATVLEGEWSTGCRAMGNAHYKVDLTYQGSGYVKSGAWYTDAACTKVNADLRYGDSKGEIAILGEGPDGSTAVDIYDNDGTFSKVVHDIFKIEGATLYFGNNPGEGSDGARAAALARDFAFRKL